jgi:ribosome-associated protein
MTKIKINTPYITLGQFLKLADLISSGGEAKFYLSENDVHINQEIDVRRGRKLFPGDLVTVEGLEPFMIVR